MRTRLVVIFASVVMMLCSCDNTQNEYTTRQCYLVLDNATHLDATLSSAMNPMAPGIFCTITKTMKLGAQYFSFSNNNGSSSSSIFNAIDQRRTVILGGNNGLIVGYSNMETVNGFYAFDAQCPNCFDSNALPVRNYALTVSGTGIATCRTCHREYNLNTGGIISKGDAGNKMTRYRASTTGPFGVLAVN